MISEAEAKDGEVEELEKKRGEVSCHARWHLAMNLSFAAAFHRGRPLCSGPCHTFAGCSTAELPFACTSVHLQPG